MIPTFDFQPIFAFLVTAFCSECEDLPDSFEFYTLKQCSSDCLDYLIAIASDDSVFHSFVAENDSNEDNNIRELCLIISNSLIVHRRADIIDHSLSIAENSVKSSSVRLKVASCWLLHSIILLYGCNGTEFDPTPFISLFIELLDEDEDSLKVVSCECIIALIKFSDIDYNSLLACILTKIAEQNFLVKEEGIKVIKELIEKESDPQIIIESIPAAIEVATDNEIICEFISKAVEKLGTEALCVVDDIYQYLLTLDIDEFVVDAVTNIFIFTNRVISYEIFFSCIEEKGDLVDFSFICMQRLVKSFDLSPLIAPILEALTSLEIINYNGLELILAIADKEVGCFDSYVDLLISTLSSLNIQDSDKLVDFLGCISLDLQLQSSPKVISFALQIMNETGNWNQEAISNFLSSNEQFISESGIQVQL